MRCQRLCPLRLAKISSEMEGGGFHFSVCGSGRRSTWIPCFMQESVTRRHPLREYHPNSSLVENEGNENSTGAEIAVCESE